MLPTASEVPWQDLLASLPLGDQETLSLRIERYLADLQAGLAEVYPGLDVSLTRRAVALMVRHFAERPDWLRRLDLRRLLRPDWFLRQDMLGYVCYTERFAQTLSGLEGRLDYLTELGVTYLHLMPLLATRPAPNDGGYAVSDYRMVRPDLGTIEDLRNLATRMHTRGISLCLDLVLNHVAAEHPWAEAARAGDPAKMQYFLMFGDRTLPDAYEQNLLEVFPDFAPGNFTWEPACRRWVWTTFNRWQWDLNWANPEVFFEFADLILFWANQGVDVFRLDAIAFIWKRLGTDCQNQPEVHALVQALRAVARIVCPAVLFKAEAIVAPEQLRNYLGSGRHHGRVSDLAYHNSLMVQIWSALASRDARLLTQAMRRFPSPPHQTGWVTYLRCHDDIGWAISDADAQAVGLSGPAHRHFLSDYYSGVFPGSDAVGDVFQFNPRTGDRRISGSAASLAGLEVALRNQDTSGAQLAIARLLLGHAVILGAGGLPVLYMGDEIALLSDRDYLSDPEHADDNRWLHRPRMDWQRAELRSDLDQVPGMVFQGLRRLIAVRQRTEQFAAETPSVWWDSPAPELAIQERLHPVGTLLAIYNFADRPTWLPGSTFSGGPWPRARDLLGQGLLDLRTGVALAPYQVLWLVNAEPDG